MEPPELPSPAIVERLCREFAGIAEIEEVYLVRHRAEPGQGTVGEYDTLTFVLSDAPRQPDAPGFRELVHMITPRAHALVRELDLDIRGFGFAGEAALPVTRAKGALVYRREHPPAG